MCNEGPPLVKCEHWEYVEKFREEKHKFNQIFAARGNVDIGEGICMSLSCLWIKLHMQQKSQGSGEQLRRECMTTRIDHFSKQENLQDAADIHEDYSKEARRYGLREGLALLTRSVALNFGGPISGNYDAKTGVKDLEKAVNKTHHYSVIGINFARGKHAIAAYKSGGKFGFFSHLYVFDPNYGEFRVGNGDIEDFFKNMFECYGQSGGDRIVRSWDVWDMTPIIVPA